MMEEPVREKLLAIEMFPSNQLSLQIIASSLEDRNGSGWRLLGLSATLMDGTTQLELRGGCISKARQRTSTMVQRVIGGM